MSNDEVLRLMEFCNLVHITRGTFYNLKRRGEAPDYFTTGKQVNITREAANRWIKERTIRTGQVAGKPPATKAQTG